MFSNPNICKIPFAAQSNITKGGKPLVEGHWGHLGILLTTPSQHQWNNIVKMTKNEKQEIHGFASILPTQMAKFNRYELWPSMRSEYQSPK